jgi:hypothetical protein
MPHAIERTRALIERARQILDGARAVRPDNGPASEGGDR